MDKRVSSKRKRSEKYACVIAGCVCFISLVDIVRYAALGNVTAALTFLLVNTVFALCALGTCLSKAYPAYLMITGVSATLFVFTNNIGTTLFNFTFALQAVISGVGAVLCTWCQICEKEKPNHRGIPAFAAILILVAGCAAAWGVGSTFDKAKQNADRAIWAVPTAFDSQPCTTPGTLEKLEYKTKAYATDGRTVTKSAWIYLPHGYNDSQKYDILYLLHGTGDDESYWMCQFQYNKIMVDQLIAKGEIEPLIIVMPTFYVENDCADNLDLLTYSFKDELRNDLMPAVESKYATYAQSCDQQGFTDSREHRAFAGLSRGAVTTLRSVFCGCLDYFAYFGTFSASRTSVETFVEANQKEDTCDLPIKYWYVASGNFDFGLVSQITDHAAIVAADSRLEGGINTSVDVFPMRYHSMGNWHLALYNFLQLIFDK